ncbi:hypothetical protein AB205_0194600, partial [Aquarana catesbeiana]
MFYCYYVLSCLLFFVLYCLLCFIVNLVNHFFFRYAIQLQSGFIYLDSNSVCSHDTQSCDSSAVGGGFTTTVKKKSIYAEAWGQQGQRRDLLLPSAGGCPHASAYIYFRHSFGKYYCYTVILLCFIVNHHLLSRYAIQLQLLGWMPPCFGIYKRCMYAHHYKWVDEGRYSNGGHTHRSISFFRSAHRLHEKKVYNICPTRTSNI